MKNKYCFLDRSVINKMMESDKLKNEVLSLNCEFIVCEEILLQKKIKKDKFIKLIDFIKEMDVKVTIDFRELLKNEIKAFKSNSTLTDLDYIKFNINDLWDIFNIFVFNDDYVKKKNKQLLSIRKELTDNLLNLNGGTNYDCPSSYITSAINQEIKSFNPDFYNEYILPLATDTSYIDKFKSVKMMVCIIYYMYNKDIKGLKNEDIDYIARTACYPYMDYIIIKEDVADKLGYIKENHNVLKNTKIFRVDNEGIAEV